MLEHANSKIMRIVVFALIVSMLFGSFSTVAHAFGGSGSVSIAKIEKSIQSADHNCFGGHNHSNKKSACLDCVHCCVPHTFMGQSSFIIHLQPQSSVQNALDHAHHASGYIFSLLRPPKLLV